MKDQIADEQSAFLVGKRRDFFMAALFIAAAFAIWHFFGVDQDETPQVYVSVETSSAPSEYKQDGVVPQDPSGAANLQGTVNTPTSNGSSGYGSTTPVINPQKLEQQESLSGERSQNESSQEAGLRNTYAEIIFLRGDAVKYSLPGKAIPIEKGSQLFAGERIETGKNSSLTLRFADQSTAIVSEQSSVLFENLQRSQDGKTGVTALELSKGQLESRVSKQKGFGAKYEVRTPAMQLAVRGTVFETQVQPGTQAGIVVVLEGQVEAAQAQSRVVLNQGFGVMAEPRQTTLKATPILAAPKINTVMTVQKQFPLLLGWQVLPRAQQYQVQLFSGPKGDQLVLEKWYRGNIASLNGLANGRYLLRVRGVDKSGLGGFYGEARFVLDVPPVTMMTLDSAQDTAERSGS